MYDNKKVSVILPTYNEKESIADCITDFFNITFGEQNHPVVDEIIVINNNAVEGTSEEVKKTKAIEIHEPIQGYGMAIRRGFGEASGDIIVVCEPDATFVANDILKLLSYSKDVDIIYGSRTAKHFIWEKSNMRFFLKWGNWAVAKMIEVLFNTNALSDVGCTYRLINRPALEKILPTFRVTSNFFGPEMMVRGYLMKIKSVQIPVNYKQRVGVSSVTGDFFKALKLGLQMIVLIIAMRFKLENQLLRFLQ